MAKTPKLKEGDIYWVDKLPLLDGRAPGRHPVVIVDIGDPCVVVGITSTECDDVDRIDLPNEEDEPGTTTGLPRPCCALPRWWVFVNRSSLAEYAGYLPAVTRTQLIEAVEIRMDDPDSRSDQV